MKRHESRLTPKDARAAIEHRLQELSDSVETARKMLERLRPEVALRVEAFASKSNARGSASAPSTEWAAQPDPEEQMLRASQQLEEYGTCVQKGVMAVMSQAQRVRSLLTTASDAPPLDASMSWSTTSSEFAKPTDTLEVPQADSFTTGALRSPSPCSPGGSPSVSPLVSPMSNSCASFKFPTIANGGITPAATEEPLDKPTAQPCKADDTVPTSQAATANPEFIRELHRELLELQACMRQLQEAAFSR
jgi:hypothetical protein